MILFVGSTQKGFFIEDMTNDTLEYTGPVTDLKSVISQAISKAYDIICIDLNSLLNSKEDIYDASYRIQTAGNSRIFFLATDYEEESELLTYLAQKGYHNFILAKSLGGMKEEYQKCLDGVYDEKYPLENISTPVPEAEASLSVDDILSNTQRKLCKTVAFCGVCGRIGTTTQALQLVKYLLIQGYKACYVEMNNSSYINNLMDIYDDSSYSYDAASGYLRKDNVDIYNKAEFLPQIGKLNYDFVIYDYGCYGTPDFNTLSFIEKDIVVVVGGADPTELTATTQVIASMSQFQKDNIYYMYSFVHEQEQKDILELMEDLADKTLFAVYAPNPLIYTSGSDELYSKLIPVEPIMKPKKNLLFRKKRKNSF